MPKRIENDEPSKSPTSWHTRCERKKENGCVESETLRTIVISQAGLFFLSHL
jgi:hypothetical protein